MDCAIFPCIIRVSYQVDGKTYVKYKWISAGNPVPAVDSRVSVLYDESKPGKAKII